MSFVEKFMNYSKFAQCPDKFLRWSAYSVLAGALERRVWLSNGATTFYPNLYIMLIGDAGTRKSSSAHLAVELLREVPEIRFMAARINEASFMSSLMLIGEQKKFKFNGEEFKHSAGYLYASEASTTFKEMYIGGSVILPLVDVFNCEPLGWSRKVGWAKHTIKDGIVNIYNPCVNLLACSTPVWFNQHVMSKNDAEAGFGSRLLLVVQKDRVSREYGWSETTTTNHQLKMELVEELKRISKLQGPFSVDDTFRAAYAHLDKQLQDFMAHGMIPNLLMGYYERKLTHATKLAMVIAASKSDELLLTSAELLEAWGLVESLEEQMIKAYTPIMGKTGFEIPEEIHGHLVKTGQQTVTKSGLIKKWKAKYKLQEITKSIDVLIRAGHFTYCLEGDGLKEPTYNVIVSEQDHQDA